ncbi:sulfite exporter TauE/SafE family protein [Brevundimonas sp.]|uniref:sulfite exporter TauE/SafE family protein n=1 Tax=Brevundimonas sp. TaxID=1871086 RepID=UPI002D50B2D3|nr:sulfite exporter TauE/SafE family protein [Brevundimonas sp.]HYC98167.1 sulfite exporter TauE/SafE family protein [Brevundimonas sp.]
MQDFLLFAAVGFAAQIVDGALGMAFGVISSTLLLSLGTPPAVASASVHAAKVFTGTASGLSHLAQGNVRWSLFWPLAVGGVIGGVIGGVFLTSVDGDQIKPWVLGWLALMGLIILVRSTREIRLRHVPIRGAAPLGLVGGFLDALGGGGWGPTVTTTLVSVGEPPRQAVGSGNAAEAVVAAAVSTTFIVALVTGHWRDLDDLRQYGTSVAGLIAGGVVAAPLAAHIARALPVQPFAWLIGVLILLLAAIQLVGPLLGL